MDTSSVLLPSTYLAGRLGSGIGSLLAFTRSTNTRFYRQHWAFLQG